MLKNMELKNNVVYRTNEFFERKYKTISKMVPDYRFNSKKDIVEKVGEIDFQEKIQSSADSDYRKIFDKFIDNGNVVFSEGLFGPNSVDIVDGVAETDFYDDKLTSAMNISNVAEEYKSQFGLDPNLSPAQVFEKLAVISEKMKVQNDERLKAMGNDIANKIKSNNMEVKVNETNETNEKNETK